MAETLILATKLPPESPDDELALFVNLSRRPDTLLEAAEVAKLTGQLPKSSRTGHIHAGEQYLGSYIRAPLSEGGCASLRESAIADVMIGLSQGILRMPRYRGHQSLPIVPLEELGNRGLLHRDIGTHNAVQPPYRGPFRIHPISPAPSYPILWGHSANRERCLIVEPDSQGEVLPGCDEQAKHVWETATRLHFNLDFRLNSQSLAACCTPDPTVGGRAWPNFCLKEKYWEHIMVLWANSTLGLMSSWWQGSLQQQGRSILTISSLPQLRVFDPRSLSDQQLEKSKRVFKEFENRQLLPANEAYRDKSRIEIDRSVLVDILGFPKDILEPLENLRLQWCNEPSVHGGKSTKP
ncbi:MAG: hypothetical protein F4Z52_10625 [Gammaproteobacteria bacterium]|nr:hypothetical protein [Gammaproteobacteria bacterium]